MRKKDAAKANAAYAQVLMMTDQTFSHFAVLVTRLLTKLAAAAAASAVT